MFSVRNTFVFLKKHAELKFGVPNQLSRRTVYYAIITTYLSAVFLTKPSNSWPYEVADSLPAPDRVTIEGIVQRADFFTRIEKQHHRFSIEGVWDMKRKILLLTLLCAIIVFSILSSALSCTIQPGPGGFSVTVRNQHTWQKLWFYKNGTRIAIINSMTDYVRNDFIASDIVRIWNADASVFLHDSGLNDSWLINGHLTFTYTGGAVIQVTAVLDDER
jgi:hypothetical protein